MDEPVAAPARSCSSSARTTVRPTPSVRGAFAHRALGDADTTTPVGSARRAGLAGIAILGDVPPERLARIEAECTWRSVDAGHYLIRRGDVDRTIFLLVSGSVRLATSSANGREVICANRSGGDFFGAHPALAHGHQACDAYTLEPSLLAAVPSDAFCRWLAEESGVARRVVERPAAYVGTLFDRVADLSTFPVGTRLDAEVPRIAHASGSGRGPMRIEPIPRHADIAASIGTYREEVSRGMSRLSRRGLVVRDGHALVVPDIGALERHVLGAFDAA